MPSLFVDARRTSINQTIIWSRSCDPIRPYDNGSEVQDIPPVCCSHVRRIRGRNFLNIGLGDRRRRPAFELEEEVDRNVPTSHFFVPWVLQACSTP
jgi:hypothetical protein